MSKRTQNLKAFRSVELERIYDLFPPKALVLEIGAGTGWQAMALHKIGHHVTAVDMVNNPYLKHAVFPIIPYDGKNLPFASASFDVVFSSNVLEHIPHLDNFETEIHRVLKPEGIAIHSLPTTSWRLWTSITHPLWVVRRVFENLRKPSYLHADSTRRATNARWYHAVWPNRHGESGNSLTEIYYFSHYAWKKHFERHGWQLISMKPLNLFYTGSQVLHNHLNMGIRTFLSNLLGSSTWVYVCKKSSQDGI